MNFIKNSAEKIASIGLLTLLGTLTVGDSIAIADERDLIGGKETRLENVTENPQAFDGRRIRLRGEIDEIHSDRTFSLEELGNTFLDNVFDEDEVLVVVGSTAGMTEESRLSVTGRVYPYNLAELERRFNLRLDPETREELDKTYTGKAMMIAERVAFLRGQ